MEIIEINPSQCTRWKYADRSSFEFGNLSDLITSIKKHGQIEPIYVRELKDNSRFKYEILAGSRRWKACLGEDITLKAIVNNVSDIEASIIQIKENDKLAVSEYSRGISFAKLKEDNKLTQDQLADITGYSRRKIQNLLAFAKVDQSIWDAVSNMSRVSGKTAETILALCNKSDIYKHALIEIAEDIRNGAGSSRIEKLVSEIVVGEELTESDNELVQSSSGQVFATWKNAKLSFARNLNIDKNALNKHLLKFFNKRDN